MTKIKVASLNAAPVFDRLFGAPAGQPATVERRAMNAGMYMLAGAGIAVALASCGQKPAPAAESTEATTDAQAMRVTTVDKRDLAEDVRATGRLVVRDEIAVGTELSGYRVAEVLVDEGDVVKKGQALARLDDALLRAQIAQAEATLAQQKANASLRKNQYDRSKSLGEAGALSVDAVDQARAAYDTANAALMAAEASVNEMRVRQARMTLRAPEGGVILQRTLRPGDISSPAVQTPYFRIARDGLVELDAELPDSRLAALKVGDAATVHLPTGEAIEGKVRFVSPRVSEDTNLGRVRIEMPYNAALRPGSFAEAMFGGLSSEANTVQSSAIRYEAGGPVLMTVDDKNTVHRTPVRLGARYGDYVEIIDGVPAGTRVLATGAAFTLDGDVIKPVAETAEAN
jgi:HlyD family secretion protein